MNAMLWSSMALWTRKKTFQDFLGRFGWKRHMYDASLMPFLELNHVPFWNFFIFNQFFNSIIILISPRRYLRLIANLAAPCDITVLPRRCMWRDSATMLVLEGVGTVAAGSLRHEATACFNIPLCLFQYSSLPDSTLLSSVSILWMINVELG